ncbi:MULTISPECIES: hypothetical protein [unclassified Bacillus (in: firmicutes)]|uniref:hypothetical protein n=1 Tax=unclassified Bacillus (in: firmicutes) TaxID=185979 RepID=UPI0008ECE8D3|nr:MULTISPECIES: hypothetical protein [unclassified Bacillus (in: firmicutes)]SFB04252.1 hypothetical protein SAMN02799634_104276 [Bacillus sp. UNCCL13]SFQ88545.1 hypothetical protein SAMN04488577_3238 [Bacillus sp. cl95]
MECNNDPAKNLEQLLGSLIKMVGKTNEQVSNLHKRINQLEWILHEMELPAKPPENAKTFFLTTSQCSQNSSKQNRFNISI